MDKLTVMLSRQFELQRHMARQNRAVDPTDPNLTQEARIQFIKDMVMALQSELQEFLQEIGWKPWATSRHINGEPAIKELVDAWHFFMNLMLAISPFLPDIDNEETLATRFTELYLAKNQVNWERASGNYTGVQEKCKFCGRDLNEVALELQVVMKDGIRYCSWEHAYEGKEKYG